MTTTTPPPSPWQKEQEAKAKKETAPGEKDSPTVKGFLAEPPPGVKVLVDSGGWEDFLVRAFTGDRETFDTLAPVLCVDPHPPRFPKRNQTQDAPADQVYPDIKDEQLTALVVAVRECGPGASAVRMDAALSRLEGNGLHINQGAVPALVARYEALAKIPIDEAVAITRQGLYYSVSRQRLMAAHKRTGPHARRDWTPEDLLRNQEEALAPIRALVGGGNLFVDLAEVMAEGLTQTLPTIAALDGKTHLLYAGASNVFYGPPGGGKTLVAVLAMYTAMQEGQDVMMLDFENGRKQILWRFQSLGCDMQLVLERLKYVEFPTVPQIAQAQAWAAKHPPGLVIIDSLAKAMGAEGLNEDLAADFLKFSAGRIQPFLATGAAVLILDHVIKSGGDNGGFARGSGSKKGDVGGLMAEFVTGEPFAPKTPNRPGKAGYVRLVVRKDREGGVGPEGATIGIVKFSPGGKTRWEFTPESDEWCLNTAHRVILSVIQSDPGCGRTRMKVMIRESGHGCSNDKIPTLLGELLRHGFVREEKGAKTSRRLYLEPAGEQALT